MELSSSKKLKAVLVGLGYWGNNLKRNLADSDLFSLDTIIDSKFEYDSMVLPKMLTSLKNLSTNDGQVAFVATPADTHYELVKELLLKGFDVWVEKPLALNLEECIDLHNLAMGINQILFVDHTFTHSPAVHQIKRILDAGVLGDIIEIRSYRRNFGIIHTDTSVIQDLAVHDFSIYEYLFGNQDGMVFCHDSSKIEGLPVTGSSLHFEPNSGPSFYVDVSWLSPIKRREITLVGKKASLVYDDTNSLNTIEIFNQSLWKIDSKTNKITLGDSQYGDKYIPYFGRQEPLKLALASFHSSILSRQDHSSVKNAIWISRILEAAKQSSTANQWIRI